MNTSSTFTTAILRGLYVAVVAGATAGLTVYEQSDNTRNAIVAGGLAFLAALTMRTGVEGSIDSNRQAKGSVSPSDVQPTDAGKP